MSRVEIITYADGEHELFIDGVFVERSRGGHHQLFPMMAPVLALQHLGHSIAYRTVENLLCEPDIPKWPYRVDPADILGLLHEPAVYAIENRQKAEIKFGRAQVPFQRLRAYPPWYVLLGLLQTSLEEIVALERDIHQMLKPFQVCGEWFRDVPQVRSLVDETMVPIGAEYGELLAALRRCGHLRRKPYGSLRA